MKSASRLALVSVVVLMTLIGVLTWSNSKIQTPEQRAALTASPAFSTITANIERRKITETVLGTGTVVPKTSVELKYKHTSSLDVDSLVTALPIALNTQVKNGQVVVEVSGRPVIVLQGQIPAYRNFKKGDSGKDIFQLQESLRQLGLKTLDKQGEFGDSTVDAVKKLYQRVGYSAPKTESEDASFELPRSEIFFLPHFPMMLQETHVSLGDQASDALLTFASTETLVEMPLNLQDVAKVKRGQTATLTFLDGTKASNPVKAINSSNNVSADLKQTPSDEQSPSIKAEILLETAHPLAQTVQIAIEIMSTSQDVLAVPVSALYSNADGQTYITRITNEGEKQYAINRGVTAGGWVELVNPSPELSINDKVVIGNRNEPPD